MDLKDISFAKIDDTSPQLASFKDISSSFLNNIDLSLHRAIITINLVLLGQTFSEIQNNYDIMIIFQIGIFIFEILGKYFLLGLIKNLYGADEEIDFYDKYLKMKSILVVLIPVIFIPLGILSYYIMELLIEHNTDIYNISAITEVYYKFWIFIPIIFIFEIIFVINLKYLKQQEKIKDTFIYVISFILCHIILSIILLYLIQVGFIGLTISYIINTFLFFFFTSIKIKKISIMERFTTFYFLLPRQNIYDQDTITLLKKKSLLSIMNIGDSIFLYFLIFVSLFTDKQQLIINIIYLNFYDFIVSINRGFYITLKKFLLSRFIPASYRQKYLIFYLFYYFIFVLLLVFSLFIFKNLVLKLYLYNGDEIQFKLISSQIDILFPISILLNCLKTISNGILRGMDIPLSIIRQGAYIFASCGLCCFLFFYWELGIYGLWISVIIYNLFFVLENWHKLIDYLPAFFRDDFDQ